MNPRRRKSVPYFQQEGYQSDVITPFFPLDGSCIIGIRIGAITLRLHPCAARSARHRRPLPRAAAFLGRFATT